MVELLVESLGARGDGVCRDRDGIIYLPYGVPGDRVEATITGQRGAARVARLDRVLQPSPGRITPPCTHFGACGGCSMQHVTHETYQQWKLALLTQALARRGFDDVPIGAMVAVPPAGRRRAKFRAGKTGKGVHLGFNAPGSHDIVDVEVCHILVPAIVEIMADLRALLADLPSVTGKMDIQITETETGLDVWLAADFPREADTDMRLADFAQSADLARLSIGARAEPMLVRRAPRVTFDGVAVIPPADGFLQASLAGERALVDLVRQGVGDVDKIADLFAGLGTFSFALNRNAAVLAVEGAADQVEALTDARNKARRGRLDVQVRDLERRPLSGDELRGYGAVVFDPPRAGAAGQSAALAASDVPVIVAVSCNPATFARDARTLADGGYRLLSVTPVDQFPWSRHLELVACFTRS